MIPLLVYIVADGDLLVSQVGLVYSVPIFQGADTTSGGPRPNWSLAAYLFSKAAHLQFLDEIHPNEGKCTYLCPSSLVNEGF